MMIHRQTKTTLRENNMNTKNLGYNYLKSLTEKVESLVKRMRWIAYFFDKDSNDSDENQNLFWV